MKAIEESGRKIRKRIRRAKPLAPSWGAQRFLELVSPEFKSNDAFISYMENWCREKKVAWRTVREYLSGVKSVFPKIELLPSLVLNITGKNHSVWEFNNKFIIKNYLVDFCSNNKDADAFLKGLRGKYLAIRPGTDVIESGDDYEYNPKTDDRNALEIIYNGPDQPSTFVYATWQNEKMKDSWKGYVVSSLPHIYLFGFCTKGADAAYMLLRTHPEREHANKMLVGIQSLLLSHRTASGPKHGVTRHMVALRDTGEEVSEEDLEIAHNWIRESRRSSPGLLVNLGEVSHKT